MTRAKLFEERIIVADTHSKVEEYGFSHLDSPTCAMVVQLPIKAEKLCSGSRREPVWPGNKTLG